MLRHILEFTAGTEVPNEQTRRELGALDLAIRPVPAILRAQQMAIGPRRIRIRHHDVRRDHLAVRKPYACCTTFVDQDFIHLRIATELNALAFHELNHALYERAGSAHRGVNTVLLLKVGDERVDRSNRIRVTANKERVKAQHRLKFGILDVTSHQRMQTTKTLHLQHLRDHLQHVTQTRKRNHTELLVTEVVGLLAGLQETVVTFDILRGHLLNLGPHGIGIAAVVEMRAIVEAESEEWRHGTNIHIVLKTATAQFPQLLEEERGGNDGWARIKDKTILAEYRCSATRAFLLLEHRHAITANAQTNGRRQPTKAATDYDRVGAPIHAKDGIWSHRSVHLGLHHVCLIFITD